MKTALIGDKDIIALFTMVGISKCSDDITQFDELVNDESLALLLITDEYAEQVKAKIIQHRLIKNLPIIIEIPGKMKIEREETIQKLIRRAVGVEVE